MTTIKILALCVASVLIFGLTLTAHAADRKCTRDEAIKAETEASTLKTWGDVLASYQRYCHCDDGAISEGYSASVAGLLAEQWNRFDELARLVKRHRSFERFVLRHVDETMSSEEGLAIQNNVRSRCPKDGKRLCELIEKRLSDLRSR